MEFTLTNREFRAELRDDGRGFDPAQLERGHQLDRHGIASMRGRAERLGLQDDDWVWVTSRHGRIKAQVCLMDGVNPDTCWTWNAIGKRAGAWHLTPDAPEATKAFLLNHLIDELLPEQGSGYRYANADPVTGQAAWYDLRVRIEKTDAPEEGTGLPALKPPRGLPEAPKVLRYGRQFRRAP